MNQILSMDNNGMGTPSGGNNFFGGGNNKKTLNKNTTVKIFAIVLIIFGLAMAIVGIVNLVTADRKVATDNWPKFDAYQEDNSLSITISHNKVIEKVIYSWNNEASKEKIGTGEKQLQLKIDVPAGDNVLNLKIIDVNGKEDSFQRIYTGMEVSDTVLPEIELYRIGNKLNIVAKSTTETPLAYLTYQWNEQVETKIESQTEADKSMLQTQTTLEKGQNTLTITAVKENGVKTTVTRTFEGVLKPSINAEIENGKLKVIMEHESGIQSAKITFNGSDITLSSDRFGADKTTVTFSLPLVSGQDNTILIEATSVAGSTETYNKVVKGA